LAAILNPKWPPKYKTPPIWAKFGFQVDYDDPPIWKKFDFQVDYDVAN
jgi:hypothetical protein